MTDAKNGSKCRPSKSLSVNRLKNGHEKRTLKTPKKPQEHFDGRQKWTAETYVKKLPLRR
jgi:hypothetical protein